MSYQNTLVLQVNRISQNTIVINCLTEKCPSLIRHIIIVSLKVVPTTHITVRIEESPQIINHWFWNIIGQCLFSPGHTSLSLREYPTCDYQPALNMMFQLWYRKTLNISSEFIYIFKNILKLEFEGLILWGGLHSEAILC